MDRNIASDPLRPISLWVKATNFIGVSGIEVVVGDLIDVTIEWRRSELCVK